MDANRMPVMSDARRLGLEMLLGRQRADDLLAFRVAQRLAITITSPPQRQGRAA